MLLDLFKLLEFFLNNRLFCILPQPPLNRPSGTPPLSPNLPPWQLPLLQQLIHRRLCQTQKLGNLTHGHHGIGICFIHGFSLIGEKR